MSNLGTLLEGRHSELEILATGDNRADVISPEDSTLQN